MNTESLTFPSTIQYTIKRKTHNNINISFYGGALIRNDLFNLSFVEPFKVVFTNKRKNKHIICFMLQQEEYGRNKYDFYIGNIEKENKRSLTAILNFVNQEL